MKVSACDSAGDYTVSVDVEFDAKEQTDIDQADKFVSAVFAQNKDGDTVDL